LVKNYPTNPEPFTYSIYTVVGRSDHPAAVIAKVLAALWDGPVGEIENTSAGVSLTHRNLMIPWPPQTTWVEF